MVPGHLQPLRRRIIIFGLVCLVAAGAILWKFYFLQIRRHDELLQKAQHRYTYTKVVKNQRGRIFDAGGNLLVGNMPRIAVECSPYAVVPSAL